MIDPAWVLIQWILCRYVSTNLTFGLPWYIYAIGWLIGTLSYVFIKYANTFCQHQSSKSTRQLIYVVYWGNHLFLHMHITLSNNAFSTALRWRFKKESSSAVKTCRSCQSRNGEAANPRLDPLVRLFFELLSFLLSSVIKLPWKGEIWGRLRAASLREVSLGQCKLLLGVLFIFKTLTDTKSDIFQCPLPCFSKRLKLCCTASVLIHRLCRVNPLSFSDKVLILFIQPGEHDSVWTLGESYIFFWEIRERRHACQVAN